MVLSDQDVTKIQEVFRTEIRSFLDDQGLDFNKHSEHHSFISGFRTVIRWVSYSAILATAAGTLGFLGKIIMQANGWFL